MSFGAGNLLQSLGLLFLYAVVVVTIVYKSFTLIFIGPDRAIDVLGWKVLQSGIEDTEGRVHGAAKEAGGAAGQAGAKAGERLGHTGEKSRTVAKKRGGTPQPAQPTKEDSKEDKHSI